MGIKNLSAYLHKQFPQIYKKVPLASFYGKRIAIDAHNWVYTIMAQAQKRMVNAIDPLKEEMNHTERVQLAMSYGMEFLCLWLEHGVIPVFVFDGDHPVEKEQTKKERYEKKAKVVNEIDEMKKQYAELDPLAITPQMIEALRMKMRQCFPLYQADWANFKGLLADIGIPYYLAQGDGEQLCSMLCIEGKVDAVYSTDTDNIAYCCPKILIGPPMAMYNSILRIQEYSVTCVETKEVLELFELTQQEFLDFCIMCGCDYNTNIPNIGVIKALKLVRQHKTIDALPADLDKTCLMHERCREMFSYVPSESLAMDGRLEIDQSVFEERSRQTLSKHMLITYLPRLLTLYNRLPDKESANGSKLIGVKGVSLSSREKME